MAQTEVIVVAGSFIKCKHTPTVEDVSGRFRNLIKVESNDVLSIIAALKPAGSPRSTQEHDGTLYARDCIGK